jgi:hypothetical protein
MWPGNTGHTGKAKDHSGNWREQPTTHTERRNPVKNEEFRNAAALRPCHAGRVAEYDTVVNAGMEAAGLGTLGEHVTVRGTITRVETGTTRGRPWSRLTVRPDAPRRTAAPIVNTLSSEDTVRLFPQA